MSTIVQKIKKNKPGRNIILRSAKLKDAGEILRLNKEIIEEGSYMLHEPDEYKVTLSKERMQIKKLSETNGSIYLVAEINKNIAGYLTFKRGSLRRTSHLGYISIFFKKQHRGKGAGRILMDELIGWAENNPGLEKLSLLVFSSNKRAIALYRKLGFKQEGKLLKDAKIDGKYINSILMYLFV